MFEELIDIIKDMGVLEWGLALGAAYVTYTYAPSILTPKDQYAEFYDVSNLPETPVSIETGVPGTAPAMLSPIEVPT